MAVWVTTDLHGNYDLWEQIKNFLKEDDTLIFLGDAVDRGSRGFEIFKELLEDDRVLFIRGNHEQMMYDAYTSIGPAATEYWKHWRLNGGQATVNNMDSLGLNYDDKLEFICKVRELPLRAEYENAMGMKFILSHAGYTPSDYFDNLWEDQKEYKLLWDRNHFNFPWPKEEKYWDIYIVHGHTPILLLKQMGYTNVTGCSPMWYENHHKLNLDAATANTGLAFLFNLDTLEYEFFMANPDYVEDKLPKKKKNKE